MQWTSIGLGTWMMEKNPVDSISALHAGIDAGSNLIDTAEMYGDGQVEEIVGEAIKGVRDKIFLVSKVLPSNATYEGTLKACHRSLKRLQVDCIDTYLLHWREPQVQLDETFRAFEKLKQQGKIRSWGVSNFTVSDLKDAVKIVGENKIVCNQVLYHLNERSIEFQLIPWCKEHKISVVAYSPLAQGKVPTHSVLTKIANQYQSTVSQVILSFLTREENVMAIPKSSDLNRTVENTESMKIQLTASEIAEIQKAFPAKSKAHLPML